MTPERMPACRVTTRSRHGDPRLRSPGAAITARRLTQLTFLVFIAAAATALGQAPTWNPRITRPLEKYDNPPGYIYRLETSPRMISPYGVFISYQANVDANGNNIVGDAANECSISVDPTNTSRMAIGWRQFNSVLSNFRQGGWGYTTDAGTTWTFPGVLENNVFRSDPVTNSDEAGTFFYLSLLQTLCENMYRSTNGGQSWTELQPDGLAGGGDKEWFTIDTTNGPGHGFQYQSNDGADCSGNGVQFQRSTDATRRTAVRPQPLIGSHRSTWVASSVVSGESIQTDCGDSVFWLSIAPAELRTITFTCWPASCRPDEAPLM